MLERETFLEGSVEEFCTLHHFGSDFFVDNEEEDVITGHPGD